MPNPTWCTQFSDQECIEGQCCLDENKQNESHSKWIVDKDNNKDKRRNILNES